MNIYVIGPVTGMPDENIAEFERVKTELWKIGASVDIPHEYINERVGWEDAMLVSVHLLTQFHPMLHHEPPTYEPHYDGIAMLDGWEQSRGARIEHDLAEALGIECRPWREWLNPAEDGASIADGGASQPIFSPAC